jgi:hypothetical protein
MRLPVLRNYGNSAMQDMDCSGGNMMVRSYLTFAGVSLALLVVLLNGCSKPATTEITASVAAAPELDVSADISHPSNSTHAAKPSPNITNQSLYSGYLWDPTSPGVAISREDAEWLSSRGYADADVIARLFGLSTADLKKLADSGNQTAQAVYAYRLANEGSSHADVQKLLIKSAASGSAFALKMGGDIYQTVPGYKDPALASAFYSLQAAEGDYSGFVQAYVVDQQMTSDQRLRSRALEEFLRRQLAMGKGSSASVLQAQRPGYSNFMDEALRSNKESGNEGENTSK